MAKKRQLEEEQGGAGWLFALGAGAGLALGMFLASRGGATLEGTRDRLAQGARDAVRRFRPGGEMAGDEDALRRLEDDVIDALLADEVLSSRGIDIGALGEGVIELSGSVESEDEAELAVSVAESVPGVEQVINRMDVEAALSAGGDGGAEWTGRVSGMGRRRQGRDTDPARSDDSRHLREVSLEHADRREFEEEGISHSRPRMAARPGTGPVNPTRFEEGELDNQEPRGQHAVPQDEPRSFTTRSHVGEGLKPGTELRLEQADVPAKPHSRAATPDTGGDTR